MTRERTGTALSPEFVNSGQLSFRRWVLRQMHLSARAYHPQSIKLAWAMADLAGWTISDGVRG